MIPVYRFIEDGFIIIFSLLGKGFNLNNGIDASKYANSIHWIYYLFGILAFMMIVLFAIIIERINKILY